MKIIFLDIDGVMNLPTTKHIGKLGALEPSLVRRFNLVVAETGAKVVLSSVWRGHPNWWSVLLAGGFEMDPFLGNTPGLPGRTRGEEIDAWIRMWDEGNEVKVGRFCVVDDDHDFLPGQKLFRTDPATGLTDSIAHEMVKYLNG